MAEMERVNPIKITDKDSGAVYELDFNRDAVRFAEARGFKLEDVPNYPATKIPEFFYYAFRMHHKKLSKEKTDSILEKMGGVTEKVMERLSDLYQQAVVSNNVQDEADLEANPRVTVEL